MAEGNKTVIDTVTSLFTKACDILFLSHPKRTSLGVFVGLVFHTLTLMFRPLLDKLSGLIELSSLTAWHYIPLGITLLHIPTIYHSLKSPTELPEDIERSLLMIRKAERDKKITKKQAAELRQELCRSVVGQTQPARLTSLSTKQPRPSSEEVSS